MAKTETVWTDIDLTAEEVMKVLGDNYNITGSWEDKLIDEFFDEIADKGENFIAGYSFKKLDYDEPFGSGPKHLYMKVTKPVPVNYYSTNVDYSKRQRKVGVFQLTGYFNSWDNGEGPGYWENTLTKVYPQVVEKFEYLLTPPKKEDKNATSTTK